MSRLNLLVKAVIFRFLAAIGRYCDHYLSFPLPPQPSFARRINSTIGSCPGKFILLFYAPPSYKTDRKKQKYPLLINFHGGGYTLGHASDDARWFAAVLKYNPDCIVVSVNYRLAPSYPFPTGIEDCVSAVLYLWKNAEEFGIDIERTSFSGFSAGGNFTFAVAIRLWEELTSLHQGGSSSTNVKKGNLKSLISFYPAVNWTLTRAERESTNPNFTPLPVPPFMAGLTDEAYLHPKPEDMSNPLLSPGLASDEILRDALPEHVVMITCWKDALLVEGEKFREKLKGVGKRVEGYTVLGVEHGWDKWPTWRMGNRERDEAYEVAARSLGESWLRVGEGGGGSG